MFKRLILKLINAVFGLNLSEADLDAFINFINLLIGLFGSKDEAVSYIVRTTRKARALGEAKAKAHFQGLEKTLEG